MGHESDNLNDELPAVEAEVDTLRERTASLVVELERRLRARVTQAKELMDNTRGTIERVRHAVDVGAQIQEHPRVVIGVSSAAALALGLGVYFAIARSIERRKPMHRLRERAHDYRALLADPHRAMHPPRDSLTKRVIRAVLIAGATSLARGLALFLMRNATTRRALPPRRLPPRTAELT